MATTEFEEKPRVITPRNSRRNEIVAILLFAVGLLLTLCLVSAAFYPSDPSWNSAGQGALFFSRHARKVTMLIRGHNLDATMSRYLIDRIEETPSIEVLTRVEVHGVSGDKYLESVLLKSVDSDELRTIPASAMFIFIGALPHADRFATILERDQAGFVLTGADLPREYGRPRGWTLDREPFTFETNIPGVFAAGDVRAGSNHRVAAAVGEGSATIHSVHRYLLTV